jgi:hypothetical protein
MGPPVHTERMQRSCRRLYWPMIVLLLAGMLLVPGHAGADAELPACTLAHAGSGDDGHEHETTAVGCHGCTVPMTSTAYRVPYGPYPSRGLVSRTRIPLHLPETPFRPPRLA